MSADLPYRPRRRFSALTRRILAFNAIALLILLGGVLWVQSNRIGLVEERIAGIRDQALIVAGALAEYTADPERRAIEPMQAEPLLRQLISPTHLRARVYSTIGRLQIDTRNLLARNLVTTETLPPPEPSNSFTAFFDRSVASVERLYDGLMGVRPLAHIEPYFEAGQNGRVYSEVNQALMGETGSSVRVNEQDKLVLSVAVPIRRFATLYGVLMMTTESGDIDDILKAERTALVEVFLVAFVALLFSAVYLAGFIAAPILRLAAAAERVRRGRAGRDAIPTLDDRNDEIGELADSLSAMTRALYDRIDAIESFAADVSHELKNPLFPLQITVENLLRAREHSPAEFDEVFRESAKTLLAEVGNLKAIIERFSDFSRMPTPELQPVNINEVVRRAVKFYEPQFCANGRPAVTPRLQLESSLESLPISADPELLHRALANLVLNALDAMPEGGTLSVRTSESNGNIRIEVADTGLGLTAEERRRLFTPYYTSKQYGTGLGLAIVQSVVSDHQGKIWVESEKGKGTSFIIELPKFVD